MQVNAPYSYENQQDNKFGSLQNYYYYPDTTANSISLLSKAMLHDLRKLFMLSVRTMDDFLLPEKNTHKVPLLLLSRLKKCTYVKTFAFVDGQQQRGRECYIHKGEETVISTIWLNERFSIPQYGRFSLLWTSAEIFVMNSLEYRA